MMVGNFLLKIVRGSRKDLVTVTVLFTFLFAMVAGDDPTVLHPDKASKHCGDCFEGSICGKDNMGIPAAYLENMSSEDCGKDKIANYCRFLKFKYHKSFFTQEERSNYCLHKCDFLKYACVNKPVAPNKRWNDAKVFIGKLIDETAEVPEIVEEIEEETIESWLIIMSHQSSLLLCLIPIVLNQYKYYNFLGATFLLFLFLLIHVLDLMPWDIAVHNIAVCFICIIGGAGSSVVYESLITTVILLICLYCCFLSSVYIQLGAVIIIFAGFCVVLYNAFYKSKGRATINMLMLLVQVYLLYCQIDFLREQFIESSLVGVTIEMCLNAIAPFGRGRFWYYNAAVLSIQFVSKITLTFSKPIVFLIVFFTQLIGLLGFRALFGAFCLYTLRYKFTASSILCGLYVYMSDCFGGTRCVLRILFNFERINGKRVCYAAGSLFLLYREVAYARELAALRFVISAIDAIFIQSSYYRASHYLDINVSFMRKEFPQQGSMPWVNLNTLELLSKFTSIVKVHTARGYRKGVGCIMRFKTSKPVMVTVDHVIKQAREVMFMGRNLDVVNRQKLGDFDDPVVCFRVPEQDFMETPVVEMINAMEYDFIDTLVFINCNEENGNTVCFVPEFHIHNGLLYATVDLAYGDSGGPCFAVLTNGTVRYCGAVSKGNGNDGGGNIISLITRPPGVKYDSSDDEMTEKHKSEVELMDIGRSVTVGPWSDPYAAHHPADDDPYFVDDKDDESDECSVSNDRPDGNVSSVPHRGKPGKSAVMAERSKVSTGDNMKKKPIPVSVATNMPNSILRNRRVAFHDERKPGSGTTYVEAGPVSNYYEEVIDCQDQADVADRARRIKTLRKCNDQQLYKRIIATQGLRAFLSNHASIINDFSNKLIWTTPLKFKRIDNFPDTKAIDDYVDYLVEKNPDLKSSKGEKLDQNRNDSGNQPINPEDEWIGKGKGKKNRKRDFKRQNKDRAYRKRAIYFGDELLRRLRSGVFDDEDVESAFDHIASGHSIDLERKETFVVPGGKLSWHYIDLHDASGLPLDYYSPKFKNCK